jgi:AcrR family transcriptional regulator
MPAVAKTSDDEIVAAARKIVETAGIDALSMQAVADAVDVRPPSLYKRFADRDALVRRVQLRAFADLRSTLERVPRDLAPRERLRRLAESYRGFARRHRRLYAAMFAPLDRVEPEDLAVRASTAEPLLQTVALMVEPPLVLPAARTLTALMHGFVSMELSSAFRLGGDIEAAYAFAIERVIEAVGRPA